LIPPPDGIIPSFELEKTGKTGGYPLVDVEDDEMEDEREDVEEAETVRVVDNG